MTVSLAALLFWLLRNKGIRRAFIQAPHHPYPFQVTDILLVLFIFSIPLLIQDTFLPKQPDVAWPQRNLSLLVTIAGQIIISIVIIILAFRRYRPGFSNFGITFTHLGQTLVRTFIYSVVVFGLTFLTLALTVWICQLFGYDEEQKHTFLTLLEQKPPFLTMFLLIISPILFAPIMEELLFRGLLQNFFIGVLTRRHNICLITHSDNNANSISPSSNIRWQGIAMSAAIFALIHPWQHWPALFVLGLALGYIYERHKNLLLSIFMHSLFNILSLAVTLIQIAQNGT